MVDPSVCSPKADVELADVVRRFGPQYSSQYGHQMMPSQKKALSDIAACCTRVAVGDVSTAVTTAMTRSGTTTAAVIGPCPKCHGSQTRQRLQERQAELLPLRVPVRNIVST